jgi:hypothetical protein
MPEAALIDLNIQYLVAGFAGGIVHAFMVRKATAWEVIGYIVVGGLTANFFVPQLLRVISLFNQAPGLAAFIVGIGGFHICRRADKWVGTWNPFGRIKNE